MADDVVDRAVNAVADRAPVDWDALEHEAGSQVERDWVHWLKVLDAVAAVPHVEDEARRPDLESTAPPPLPNLSDGVQPRWGKYTLVKNVGDGGFGSVYKAWDPDLELEVALKVLHRRVADAALRDALLKEGRALARIKHHNVVRVMGVELHEDQIALCMEFVHGETLEEVLRRSGPLNAREAALVGQDLCRALAAVHGAGFVHRDVKARNVMRERDGRIVLMDFGAGQQAEDLKVPGRIPNVGTPMYMAPEIFAGGAASAASDIYSVGVLLYYLVTGQYPVEGKTPEELRRAHEQGRRRPLAERRPDLPSAYTHIIERALSSDAERRYESAAAMLVALEEAFGWVPPDWTPRQWAQAIGTGLVVFFALLTALGLVTSLEFSYGLGITDFLHESIFDWAWLGFRSSVGTMVTLSITVFVCSLLVGLRHVVITASRRARRVDARAWVTVSRLARSLRLDDAHTRGALLLLASAGLLVWAWMYFQPLLGDLLLAGNLWSASAEKLHLLSPANREYHYSYRMMFTNVLVFAGAAWTIAWRFRPSPPSALHYALMAGLSTVFVMTLFSLDLPFRVLYLNEFSVVRWRNVECYVIGERPDDVLLFCPTLSPRNRLAGRQTGEIEAQGRKENLFTPFGGTTELAGSAGR